jgi:transcriptional regulator with XRE-family HTH domain
MQKFINRLRTLRKRHGLTQQALAAKLDLSLSSVSHWENGDGTPGPTNLRRISELLGCSIPYLLGEDDNPNPQGAKGGTGLRPNQEGDKSGRSTTGGQLADGQIERQTGPSRKVPVVSWAKAGAAQDYGDLCNQIDEQLIVIAVIRTPLR